MGGITGVGGKYESFESKSPQNQRLIDAEKALNKIINESSEKIYLDLQVAAQNLDKALDDPSLTPKQKEHVQNALDSIKDFMMEMQKSGTGDMSLIQNALNETRAARQS